LPPIYRVKTIFTGIEKKKKEKRKKKTIFIGLPKGTYSKKWTQILGEISQNPLELTLVLM
jgi:hypothetical protein